jgi:hypothetical protein
MNEGGKITEKCTALVTARKKKREIYILVENTYYIRSERSLFGEWKL